MVKIGEIYEVNSDSATRSTLDLSKLKKVKVLKFESIDEAYVAIVEGSVQTTLSTYTSGNFYMTLKDLKKIIDEYEVW